MLPSSRIGSPLSMCLKIMKGFCGPHTSWQEVGTGARERGLLSCFLLEVRPSNKAVHIFEVGAITQVVSEPANDLWYCRVSFFEDKDDGDGF